MQNIRNKRIIKFCVAVLLIALVAIGTTYAYLYSSNTKVNTFGIGENVSQITEEFEQPTSDQMVPGGKVTKDVRVTNTGMPSFTTTRSWTPRGKCNCLPANCPWMR